MRDVTERVADTTCKHELSARKGFADGFWPPANLPLPVGLTSALPHHPPTACLNGMAGISHIPLSETSP